MATIPFDVRNRWTGEVQFTAQIECAESALPSIKLGLAVRGADLSGADLSGADLSDADLSDADLRSFKADLWMILASAQAEIPGLIAALREGRVNGSTYHGACACLVGTIANVRGVPVEALEKDSSRPAERWFLMIKTGDKPGDDTGGGFASKTALDWTLEYCRLHGIDAGEPAAAQASA